MEDFEGEMYEGEEAVAYVADVISEKDLEDEFDEIDLSQWIFDTFPCDPVKEGE